MAEISNNQNSGANRHAKPRSKKLSARVDLTPMVDLAFLLITFFMLTIVVSDPRQMKLDMPTSDGTSNVGDCQVLHVVVDSADRLYTYEGLDIKGIKQTSFNPENGIRQVLMAKANAVHNNCPKDSHGKLREMVCLIKLLPGARYNSMINILDEMEITGTRTYALQDPNTDDISAAETQRLLANAN